MRSSTLPATDVTVVDLSRSGVRISSEAKLDVGEEISIGLAGVGTRRAYVAWARGGEYGCAFELPLEAADEGRAFANASVVRLGSLAPPDLKGAPSLALQSLYAEHRFWDFPMDAWLALAAYLLLFASLGWYAIRAIG